MAKVRYLYRDIEEHKKENERLREQLDHGIKYIEQRQVDMQQALEVFQKGGAQAPKPAKFEE